MPGRLNILLLFLIIFQSVFGQDKTSKPLKFDTAYIRDVSNKLSIRLYGINKFNRFDIHDKQAGYTVKYSPNSSVNLGFGINYRWFGLAVAFDFPFINNDDKKYGHTNRLDVQTNIFTKSLAVDLNLQYYQGFYIENPDTYDKNWIAGDPFPQRPDAITTTLGASCLYIFNHRKYSSRAAFIQTEVQKKSAGSFLLGGFLSLFALAGDSSFIPYQLQPEFNPDLLFNQLEVSDLGVAFGYTHTFVMWKKLSLSLALSPGISFQNYNVNYLTAREQIKGSYVSLRFLGRFSVVYNTQRSYFGLTATDDSYNGNTGKNQENSLTYQVGVVRFFYGRRFDFKF